jgi:hypothetical protein
MYLRTICINGTDASSPPLHVAKTCRCRCRPGPSSQAQSCVRWILSSQALRCLPYLAEIEDPSYCMLGLRPRLKHRPSLFDLIQRHNLEAGPFTPTSNSSSVDDELPTQIPLPASPASPRKTRANSTPPPASIPIVRIKTPPKRVVKAKMAPANTEEDENTGKVFSVSGPVIVAEDMIGCAMYELVCVQSNPIYNNILIAKGPCRP